MTFRDAGDAREDLPGRAVAALERIVLDERCLHGMERVAGGKPLDSGDLRPLVHHCERQAGVDPPSLDQDRARAAGALVAPFLGSGQAQMLAQGVEERGARIQLQALRTTIDDQLDL